MDVADAAVGIVAERVDRSTALSGPSKVDMP